jgi:plasmid stability protein
MKNITLKIDDETYHKARIKAAKAGTSVSAMVREFLNRVEDMEVDRESKRIEALEVWYATLNKRTQKGSEPAKPLTREEIYATRIR